MEHNGFLADLWAFLKNLAPMISAALGSAIALGFLGQGISFTKRLTSFGGGMACAIYLGGALIEYYHITGPHTQDAIKFTIGLFALAVVRELMKEIGEIKLLQSIRDRFFGAKNGNS